LLFTFKKEYKPLIISGRKTQTVRVWKKCTLREGRVIKSPGLGRLRIDEIAQIKLKDLTEEDARLDGFDSRAEMLSVLKKIYKLKQTDNPTCYRVRFKYLGEDGAGKKTHQPVRIPSGKSKNRKTTHGETNRKKTPTPGATRKNKRNSRNKSTGSKNHSRQETLFPPF
jgi:uncharacterized protein YqfB (UPF0267 family)